MQPERIVDGTRQPDLEQKLKKRVPKNRTPDHNQSNEPNTASDDGEVENPEWLQLRTSTHQKVESAEVAEGTTTRQDVFTMWL